MGNKIYEKISKTWKNAKQALLIVCMAVMVLALAGCGSTPKADNNSAPADANAAAEDADNAAEVKDSDAATADANADAATADAKDSDAATEDAAPEASEPADANADAAATEAQEPDATADASEAKAAVDASETVGYTVTMEKSYRRDTEDGDKEVAKIVCTNASGETVWEKEILSMHGVTELEQIQEIGQRDGVYYFNWSGTVTALSLKDGSELWKNPDFTGASIQSAFTDDGRILLCGYYGPALFVCDTNGNTIKMIPEIENWYWPYELKIVDGYAEIKFDNAEGEGIARVNLETYEYELVR